MDQNNINIDFDPHHTTLTWGGGIDDTLGVILCIERYGANNLNIMTVSRDRFFPDLYPYTNALIDTIGIDRSRLKILNRPIVPTGILSSQVASFAYYMMENDIHTAVDFMTEGNEIRVRQYYTYAKRMLYFVPQDYKYADIARDMAQNPMKYRKFPFDTLTREDIIDIYYEKNLQHLLHLTRSCGAKTKQAPINHTMRRFTETDLENNLHCGVCPRCTKRKYSFKSLNVTDPTQYYAS
jgi:hypothetical protein